MQIEVKESIPSPYAIFFLLSLFVGFITFALILRKRGVSRQIVMLDACLNIMLVLYLGMMFTLVVSGFKNFAFSSLGGALGIILSTFTMSKVTKQYAADSLGCHVNGYTSYLRHIETGMFSCWLLWWNSL